MKMNMLCWILQSWILLHIREIQSDESFVWLKIDYHIDKILLNCKVTKIKGSIHFFGPDGIRQGYCTRPGLQRKQICTDGTAQNFELNITTLLINRPLTKDTIGEWKCTHGVSQAYDTVVIKPLDSYCGYLQQDVPKLGYFPERKSDLWIERNSSYFNMSCLIYQLPLGDSINVLLNSQTTSVLRLYNNKCFTKDKQCSNDSCSCVLANSVFTIFYIYKLDMCTNCTFGVNIITEEINGIQKQITLTRYFNGKDFGKLQTLIEPIESTDLTKSPVPTLFNCANKELSAAAIMLAVLLITLIVVVGNKAQMMCKGEVKKTRTYNHLNTNDVYSENTKENIDGTDDRVSNYETVLSECTDTTKVIIDDHIELLQIYLERSGADGELHELVTENWHILDKHITARKNYRLSCLYEINCIISEHSFVNSPFYVNNNEISPYRLTPFYWTFCTQSYKNFCVHMDKILTKGTTKRIKQKFKNKNDDTRQTHKDVIQCTSTHDTKQTHKDVIQCTSTRLVHIPSEKNQDAFKQEQRTLSFITELNSSLKESVVLQNSLNTNRFFDLDIDKENIQKRKNFVNPFYYLYDNVSITRRPMVTHYVIDDGSKEWFGNIFNEDFV